MKCVHLPNIRHFLAKCNWKLIRNPQHINLHLTFRLDPPPLPSPLPSPLSYPSLMSTWKFPVMYLIFYNCHKLPSWSLGARSESCHRSHQVTFWSNQCRLGFKTLKSLKINWSLALPVLLNHLHLAFSFSSFWFSYFLDFYPKCPVLMSNSLPPPPPLKRPMDIVHEAGKQWMW